MLSKSLLDELETILKEDYGKESNSQEVSQMANNLVDYFDLLAKLAYRAKEKVENPDLLPGKK